MFLTLALALAADPDPQEVTTARAAEVAAESDRVLEWLRPALKRELAELKRLRKSRVNKRLDEAVVPNHPRRTIYFPTDEERAEALEKAEAEVEQLRARITGLENGTGLEFPQINPTAAGSYGQVSRSGSFRVVQDLGGGRVLAEFFQDYDSGRRMDDGTRVMGNRKHFALIEGLDPDGRYIDGKGSNAPGLWESSSTYTYETTLGGSRTVPRIVPLDAGPIIKEVQRLREEEKKTAAAE